jgi:hypothetical protein
MTDIVDTHSKEAFSDIQLQQALLDEQAQIAKELQASQDFISLPYNSKATVLHIPKAQNSAAFTITLAPEHCRTRQLIFGVFNAATFRYLMTDDFLESRREILRIFKHVWRYLNVLELTDENRTTWLKDFEAWRVSEDGVKTQSTGLSAFRLAIGDALALSAFAKTLTDYEREYLATLAQTPIAPLDKANAVNLNQWFSQHTWLRRDDIGIGHDLYARLGSPRVLMNSFRITIENALLYLQSCKDAFINSFKLVGITPEDIPASVENAAPDGDQPQYKIVTAKVKIINCLSQKIAPLLNDIPHLKNALELVIFTEVKPQYRKEVFDKLLVNLRKVEEKRAIPYECFSSSPDPRLFDAGFLRQLALHAASSADNDATPISLTESLLFSYLMAYQTIQGSDIPKLTLRDFKFVKRINGDITHIESSYFKGRARNNVHQVDTLKTKDDIGKAVLRYILDATALRDHDKPLTPMIKTYACNPSNLSGLLCLACTDTALWQLINEKHQAQRVAPVFPEAMHALLCRGVNRVVVRKSKVPCESIVSHFFFGFAHIKTSAVYAGSNNFDPTSLINTRSHTNKTERDCYLVEMNQEWQNNCGRVTRAVMRDLYVNVFMTSESDKQLFESEFTKAFENVKARADDVLARLKVVTEQTSGRVDELGLISKATHIDGDLPDTIYIQNTPETVLKLMHFLAQLQEKHTLLRECAPEFLFFTALPTAEWIENMFDNKRFSKASLEKGKAMYDEYRSHLPPHFTAQLL